jgi:hypothetical protein
VRRPDPRAARARGQGPPGRAEQGAFRVPQIHVFRWSSRRDRLRALAERDQLPGIAGAAGPLRHPRARQSPGSVRLRAPAAAMAAAHELRGGAQQLPRSCDGHQAPPPGT